MLRNYFKITWRNLRHHSFYTGLNIFGLSLGISGALMLFLFIQYHLAFNTHQRQAAQIYRVVTDLSLDDGSVKNENGAPVALATAIRNEIPQVKDQAFLFSNYRDLAFTVAIPQVRNGPKLFSEHGNIGFADGHWFKLFDYEWIAGDPANALEQPNTVVLMGRQAVKYFGNENPIGKIIRINHQDVRITGLLKDPTEHADNKINIFISGSSLKIFYPDMYSDMETSWGWINSSNAIFLLLPEGLSPVTINQSIVRLTKEHMGDLAKYYDFHLQPLNELHFDSRYGGTISKSLLTTLGIVGFMILLIACVNFINLATAQNARRTKEVSTRRILGSSASGIFWQFMIETACIAGVAMVLSLVCVYFSLPVLNKWLQTNLVISVLNNKELLMALFSVLIFIIISAGIYPSFMLSRYKPIELVQGRSGKINQPWLRRGLIIFQNLVAQTLIICTLIISLQSYYVKTADLGFNKNEVIMIPVPKTNKADLNYLRTQLLTHSNIKEISFCFRPPASETFKAGSIKFDQRDWESYSALGILGDAHYLNTFGLHLIAGRNIAESDTVREFLVSEEMIHKLGFTNLSQVLGHRLVAGTLNDHPGTIVGIVKDLHLHSLRSSIEPLLITSNLEDYANAGVKIAGSNSAATIAEIKATWESIYPDHIFEYHFLDEQIAAFYQKEDLLNKMTGSFALLAIGISCVGLLGLISLLTTQRTKEIGIRKVLGASVANITSMISKDFAKLIVIALLFASAIAWFVMNHWLQGFAYRITIPFWVFLVAGIGNLTLALLTICYHAIKAAGINPVKNLRTE